MTSQDVIHSLFLPALRIKQDVLPDRYTYLWFTARQDRHLPSHLRGILRHRTLAHGRPHRGDAAGGLCPLDRGAAGKHGLAREGEALFRSLGCSGCHAAARPCMRPTSNGAFGRSVHLADGRTVTADEAYLRDSILLPGRDVVAGYRAGHAELPGQRERRADDPADRLPEIARRRKRRSRAMTDIPLDSLAARQARQSISRKAILSPPGSPPPITSASPSSTRCRSPFFSSSAASPSASCGSSSSRRTAALLSDDQYNRLFTLHGIVMVWFFLVPSIPATLGNFLLPLMIGARGRRISAPQSVFLVSVRRRRGFHDLSR